MCTPRLPVELYRDIVDNVVHRPVLAKLLLVSAAFHYEAERALYRHVYAQDSKIRSKSLQPLLTRLETDKRVTSLVRSLTLISSKPFPTGLQRLSLRHALVAMVNLESFEISAPYTLPEATLGFIMKGTKFRLRTLRSNLPLRDTCKTFLSSQTGLTTLELTNECSVTPSALASIKLPSLETLSVPFYSFGDLGARNLIRLRCEKLNLAPNTKMPSLKVLSLTSPNINHDLHRNFPNLVFLEVGSSSTVFRPSVQQLPQTIENLPFLTKLKVSQQNPSTELVSQAFSSSASLQVFEIHPRFHSRKRFECAPTDKPTTKVIDANENEWRTFDY